MAKSRKRYFSKKKRRASQKINWKKYPIIGGVLAALLVVVVGVLFMVGTLKIFDGSLYYRAETIDEWRVYDQMFATCDERALLEETPIGAFVAYCDDESFHLFYREGLTMTHFEMFFEGPLTVERLPAYVYFVRIPQTPLFPSSIEYREIGFDEADLLRELDAFYAYIYGDDALNTMQPVITFLDDFTGEIGEVRVRFSAALRNQETNKQYYANPPGSLSEVMTLSVVPKGDDRVKPFDADVPMDLRHIDQGEHNHLSFESAYKSSFCAYHDLDLSACGKVSLDTSDVDFNSPSSSWEDYPFTVEMNDVKQTVYVHIYAVDAE